MTVHNRSKITCCKDCPDRYPGCHSKCEKYIQQRAEYDATLAEYKKKREINAVLQGQMFHTIYKTTKWTKYRSKHR